MGRASRTVWITLGLAATSIVAVVAGSSAYSAPGTQALEAQTNRPLHTAFLDPAAFAGPDSSAAFDRARFAGARYVRVLVNWPRVAPAAATMPPSFNPRSPDDPRYSWAAVDTEITTAVAKGFAPIVYIQGAPLWAQGGGARRPGDGPVRPSPAALGDFAFAFASRFNGATAGLPRVRFWQIWNEPNLSIQLMPQTEGGSVVSPDWYREMVNEAGRAVHAVHSDNVVIAGGLAPFGGGSNDPTGGAVPGQERIHPLAFMRQMLCMSAGPSPKATCNVRSEFDVWAHHPYTYGGPTHSAFHPDDVSLGDLGDMKKLLDAATAVGHINSRQKPAFWVTEFSYDSQPADPKGLPPVLHARWVSESLFRMWSKGVSLVTWFLLRDEPFPQQMFQSGLYYRGASGIASDRPKLALTAFRFPFVAFRQKTGAISYWGRTTTGTRKAVVVEQKQGARWRKLVAPRVDRYGIFQGKVTKVPGSGALRARLANGSDRSLAFSLTVPPDFRFCPWGSFC